MYSELHAASGFSFLRGSSLPEDLVGRAAQLGLATLALVDRDGVSGAPRFFQAGRNAGIRPLVGAALTLAGGGALPLLAESQAGYRKLRRLITDRKFPAGMNTNRPSGSGGGTGARTTMATGAPRVGAAARAQEGHGVGPDRVCPPGFEKVAVLRQPGLPGLQVESRRLVEGRTASKEAQREAGRIEDAKGPLRLCEMPLARGRGSTSERGQRSRLRR